MKNPVSYAEHYRADRPTQTNFMLALRSYSMVYIQENFYIINLRPKSTQKYVSSYLLEVIQCTISIILLYAIATVVNVTGKCNLFALNGLCPTYAQRNWNVTYANTYLGLFDMLADK